MSERPTGQAFRARTNPSMTSDQEVGHSAERARSHAGGLAQAFEWKRCMARGARAYALYSTEVTPTLGACRSEVRAPAGQEVDNDGSPASGSSAGSDPL